MAPLNGIDHGDAHSAIGDVIATLGIAKLIAKKSPKCVESKPNDLR